MVILEGGVFTKLKQCKQTTGPKSVVLGAEMHRTGGRNPLYHVIISHKRCQWASSTGLTAVSKFKLRLPAQWAVGTHRKGPSRMEKVFPEWTDQSEIRLKFELEFSS